jgi:D-alanine transaminase
VVYLNGNFIQKNKAYISVMDRGFLFGDGVYEVFPVYNRHIFGLDPHLNRLQDGLDSINIKNPHTKDEWISLINKLISFNKGSDNQAIYLQVSRGCDKDRNHTHGDLKPTVYIQSTGLNSRSKEILLRGGSAIFRDDIRWSQCNTKATSLLANTMYAQEAKENDAEEAILCRDGVITEGSSSNVFIVKKNCIYTHPKGPLILPGITREIIIDCANHCGIDLKEIAFDKEALMNADEVWISSSTREVLPITYIDAQQINNGQVGPIWSLIYNQYQVLKGIKA